MSCRERDIADLLTLYGVDDGQERAALLQLAREANAPRMVAPLLRCLAYLTSAMYLDKRGDLDRYLAVMDQLLLEAGPLAATAEILRDISRGV